MLPFRQVRPVRPARLMLLMACVLVAAACGRGDDSAAAPSSTTSPATVADQGGSTGSPTASDVDPALLEELTRDPDVAVAVLDNGMTYYIRENDSPGGRAELRLVVAAGSLDEDPDQSGVAHFLEHMMFNGTERFPVNELTRVLESFGPRFGPDINAYTSYDETVYRLSVPTDDPAVLELGLDVLAEWASKATILQSDVEAERGVVFEEWRLRDQGSDGRIAQAFDELLVGGTPYDGRLPIGEPEAIEVMDADLLRRFYEDWYRPDLMAVVAVGDFDAGRVEELIVERFGALEMPADPRPPARPFVEPAFEPRAKTLADRESPQAFVQVNFAVPSSPTTTVGDVQDGLVVDLALQMLANRANDDALRGAVPYYQASAFGFEYTSTIDVFALGADAEVEQLAASLEALMTEVARAARFGFTQAEFDRAVAGARSNAEQARDGQESRQDVQFADDYVAEFLTGSTAQSADRAAGLVLGALDRITVDDVSSAFAELIATVAPAVLAVGPDQPPGAVPDAAAVMAAMEDVALADVEQRDGEATVAASLMDPPAPAAVVSRSQATPFGYTQVVLENGVTASFWETEIAENLVTLEAASWGGTSLLAVDEVADAELIAGIVARSGVGDFDQVEVERVLAERLVQVTPYIDEIQEGFFGTAASEDLEVLFQLLHLYMREPRADTAAVAAVIAETRPLSESPEDVPDLAARIALIDAYYDGDPRYFAIPPVAELDAFDAGAALDIYRERFGNAGDFAFAFVGDFEIDEAVELAARYLGTLPSSADREEYIDHQPFPSPGVDVRVVEAGRDPQGVLQMAFTAPLDGDVTVEVTARLLGLIGNTMLRDRIREELSASYSPFLSIDVQYEPDPFVESYVEVAGDPEELDDISREVLAVLERLRTSGPSAEQLATAQEQLTRDLELVSNPFLADQLVFYALHPDQDITDIRTRLGLVDTISAAQVTELARTAFPSDRWIEIRLVPRG